MLMESKPWTIYWFSQSQKKEYLNRMREIQFRETSVVTEWIKYNTNGIKTGSSKKPWFTQSQEKAQLNPVEQQDSTKLLLKSSRLLLQMQETEIIASKHEKQNQASRNIGQYEYYNCFVNQAVTS